MHIPTVDRRAVSVPGGSVDELAEHKAVQVSALLVASALLRIGAAGGTVAVQLDVTDLAGGNPHGVVVGLVGAAQAGSEMIFAFALARFADRFGRKRFLVGGPLIGMAALLLVSLGQTPREIVACRLVEGIGAAAFVPTALGTIAAVTSHDFDVRARASGAFEGSTIVGYAGGFLVGGFAYHSLGRGAFIVLAGFYLLAALVCWRLVPRFDPLPISPLRTVVRTIVGPGPVRSFIPAWLAVNGLVGAWIANLPSLLKRNADPNQTLVHHFDERLIATMLDVYAALLVLGILVWTPYLRRHGGAVTMRRTVPGVFLLVGSLFVMNHVPLGWSALLIPLPSVAVLIQAGFGPAAVSYLADCSEELAADRSVLMAFYTVTLAGGGAVGALVGGLFQGWLRLDGLLLLGAILGVIAYATMGRVLRDQRRRLALTVTAPSVGSAE